jgi:hypothetical protein
MSTEKSRLENVENIALKKPAKASSGRRSHASARRSAAPKPIATATTVHPLATLSGPRHTASTAMPASNSITTDMPGMSAMRSTVVRMPSQFAASHPGTISNNASSAITSRFCGRFSSAPGCASNFAASSAAAARARSTTSVGGTYRPSPSITKTSGPTSTPCEVTASRLACSTSLEHSSTPLHRPP